MKVKWPDELLALPEAAPVLFKKLGDIKVFNGFRLQLGLTIQIIGKNKPNTTTKLNKFVFNNNHEKINKTFNKVWPLIILANNLIVKLTNLADIEKNSINIINGAK